MEQIVRLGLTTPKAIFGDDHFDGTKGAEGVVQQPHPKYDFDAIVSGTG